MKIQFLIALLLIGVPSRESLAAADCGVPHYSTCDEQKYAVDVKNCLQNIVSRLESCRGRLEKKESETKAAILDQITEKARGKIDPLTLEFADKRRVAAAVAQILRRYEPDVIEVTRAFKEAVTKFAEEYKPGYEGIAAGLQDIVETASESSDRAALIGLAEDAQRIANREDAYGLEFRNYVEFLRFEIRQIAGRMGQELAPYRDFIRENGLRSSVFTGGPQLESLGKIASYTGKRSSALAGQLRTIRRQIRNKVDQLVIVETAAETRQTRLDAQQLAESQKFLALVDQSIAAVRSPLAYSPVHELPILEPYNRAVVDFLSLSTSCEAEPHAWYKTGCIAFEAYHATAARLQSSYLVRSIRLSQRVIARIDPDHAEAYASQIGANLDRERYAAAARLHDEMVRTLEAGHEE